MPSSLKGKTVAGVSTGSAVRGRAGTFSGFCFRPRAILASCFAVLRLPTPAHQPGANSNNHGLVGAAQLKQLLLTNLCI